MVITETWLNPDIHDSEIVPPAYALLRTDRDGRGGGVAIAIKRNTPFHKESGIAGHESVWCSILINNVPVLIGGVYRFPGAPDEYLVKLQNFLHGCVGERTKLILTGDFNMPGINWDTFAIGNPAVKVQIYFLTLCLVTR